MNRRMDAFRARIAGSAFGGDYKPEKRDRPVWDEDVKLMAERAVVLPCGAGAGSPREPVK
jgi:hypothetical protein